MSRFTELDSIRFLRPGVLISPCGCPSTGVRFRRDEGG